jgi:hypothetical protein
MAPIVPPSTCEPLEQLRDGNAGTILARHVGSSKQKEQREQITELSAFAIDKPRWLGSGCFEAWFGRKYGQSSLGVLTTVACAIICANAQGWTAPGWTEVLPMIVCAGAGTFSGHWTPVLLLVLSAMIVCTDALVVPPYPHTQGAGGSDTAISLDIIENASAPNSESDFKTPGTPWSTWATLGILLVGVAGGVEVWTTLKKGRERLIHAMFHIYILTLVVAAAPMILHQAGGIETEVNGPLWALWAGAHLNFVLRGALLLRNKKIGYPSPLAYVGILAILWHLVFLAAGEQSSRLCATVATLAITFLQHFVLRAVYGELQLQETAHIR